MKGVLEGMITSFWPRDAAEFRQVEERREGILTEGNKLGKDAEVRPDVPFCGTSQSQA